ncbi:MAG: NAD(P)H-binding protein [Myxococcota bacterium]
MTIRRVLLTGATGFVGRHLHPALVAGGYDVRCATRDPKRARKTDPDRTWVELDVDRPETLQPALQGCDAAFYLVHGLDAGGSAHPDLEARQAEAFRDAAREAGLQRIVYLGAVEPQGKPSRHLQSRLEVGRILRAGAVPTVEVRAAMILGAGSASWRMVSDLAARLPAMILPRWLQNRSWPVAIDDVVVALLAALRLPDAQVGCYDAPGPEGLSHRLVLERVASQLGARPPMWNVPVLTPRLSSYWVALVTRVGPGLAQELVEGLQCNLDPSCHLIWEHIPGHRRMSLEEASTHALLDERDKRVPSARARAVVEELGRSFGRGHAAG